MAAYKCHWKKLLPLYLLLLRVLRTLHPVLAFGDIYIYICLCRLGRVKLPGVRKDINSWKDFDTPLFPTPALRHAKMLWFLLDPHN